MNKLRKFIVEMKIEAARAELIRARESGKYSQRGFRMLVLAAQEKLIKEGYLERPKAEENQP